MSKTWLIITLDAPMLSFGAPLYDKFGRIQDFPALSMVTGLLGNALGYSHADFEQLSSLQNSLVYGCRRDLAGNKFTDYQTVSFQSEHMSHDTAWTTRGSLQSRTSGAKTLNSPDIRQRDYLMDAVYTLSVGLLELSSCTIEELRDALVSPSRPLFIGRKCCLPATPLVNEKEPFVTADSVLESLKKAPLHPKAWVKGQSDYSCLTWYEDASGELLVTDQKDWESQVHVGSRRIRVEPIIYEGSLDVVKSH